MADWVKEAEAACEALSSDDRPYSDVAFAKLDLKDMAVVFIPRALKALRAADELVEALEDWKKGKEPAFIVDEALAAYRKARS